MFSPFGNIKLDIVKEGLVLNLDANDRTSLVQGKTTWYDLSGKNNHGTLVNGPSFNSDNGGSVVFDGSNDYVRVLHSSTISPTKEISFGCWIFKTSWTDSTPYRALSKTETGGYQIGFNETGVIPVGNFGAIVHLGGTYYGSYYPNTNLSIGWNHVFVTCDGRYVRLYLNGTLVNTNDKGSKSDITYSVNNSLIVGAEAGASTLAIDSFLVGSVAKVLIYNRSLTSQEVFQNYICDKDRYPSATISGELITNGLRVNLEAFNTQSYNGSGTTWYDLSGNGYNATLNGTTIYSNKYMDLLDTQDTTNYITIPTGSIQGLTQWTLDLWMYKHSNNSAISTFFTAGQDGVGNRFLYYLNSVATTISYENTAVSTINHSIPNLTPFLLTFVGSGNQISMYRNGSFVGSFSNNTTITAVSTIGLVLGQEMDSTSGNFDSTQKFKGKYGVVRIYNRNLSSTEVYKNYLYTYSKYYT